MTDLYAATRGLKADELIPLDSTTAPELPADCLLAEFGMVLTHVGSARSRVRMSIGRRHLNQRGLVQAGALVAFADAAAGWATYAAVEHGRFTTLELRCSLLRAAHEGDDLVADARAVHVGRRTAVFDVDITLVGTEARTVARFGCTQLILDGQQKAESPEGRG